MLILPDRRILIPGRRRSDPVESLDQTQPPPGPETIPHPWFRWGIAGPAAVVLALFNLVYTTQFVGELRPLVFLYVFGGCALAIVYLALPWSRPGLKVTPAFLLGLATLLANAPNALSILRAWPVTQVGVYALGAGSIGAMVIAGTPGASRAVRVALGLVPFALLLAVESFVVVHVRVFRLPDASELACVLEDLRVRPLVVHDASVTGPTIDERGFLRSRRSDPREIARLPDRTLLVTYGGDSGGYDGTLVRSPAGEVRVVSSARGLALSLSRRALTVVAPDFRTVVVHDLDTLEVRREARLPFEKAEGLLLDEDVDRLYAYGEGGHVAALDPRTLELQHETLVEGVFTKHAVFRPGSPDVLLRSYDGALHHLDASTFSLTRVPVGTHRLGLGLATTSGEIFVPTSNGTGIVVLDAATLERRRILGGAGCLRKLTAIDGRGLLAGGDFLRGTVRVVDAATGDARAELHVGTAVRPVVHDPVSGSLLVGSNVGVFEIALADLDEAGPGPLPACGRRW